MKKISINIIAALAILFVKFRVDKIEIEEIKRGGNQLKGVYHNLDYRFKLRMFSPILWLVSLFCIVIYKDMTFKSFISGVKEWTEREIELRHKKKIPKMFIYFYIVKNDLEK